MPVLFALKVCSHDSAIARACVSKEEGKKGIMVRGGGMTKGS